MEGKKLESASDYSDSDADFKKASFLLFSRLKPTDISLRSFMSSLAQTSARFLCQFSAKIHKQRYPCCSPCQAWSDKRSWSTLQGCLWHFSANGYSVIGLIVACAVKRETVPEAVLIHDVTPKSTNYKDKLGVPSSWLFFSRCHTTSREGLPLRYSGDIYEVCHQG